jgi:hypothetical protein
MGYQQGIVVVLTSLGHTRLDQRQRDAALEAFGEAMNLARASVSVTALLRTLDGVARGLASSDPETAVRLVGATDDQCQAIGAHPYPSERRYLNIGWRRPVAGSAPLLTTGPGRMQASTFGRLGPTQRIDRPPAGGKLALGTRLPRRPSMPSVRVSMLSF